MKEHFHPTTPTIIKYLDNGVLQPVKAHETDTGFDIFASDNPKIVGESGPDNKFWAIDYIEYRTNLFIEPDPNFCVYVFPRSSISKYNLLLCNSIGLLDNGYRFEILLRFKYIIQPIDCEINFGTMSCQVNSRKIYSKGDKIAQLVVVPVTQNVIFQKTQILNTTARNIGGFGSTGI